MKYYVLRYPNGSLVGVDYTSGGYPYEAYKTGSDDSLRGVTMYSFTDGGKKNALEYSRRLHSENFELAVLEFTINKA